MFYRCSLILKIPRTSFALCSICLVSQSHYRHDKWHVKLLYRWKKIIAEELVLIQISKENLPSAECVGKLAPRVCCSLESWHWRVVGSARAGQHLCVIFKFFYKINPRVSTTWHSIHHVTGCTAVPEFDVNRKSFFCRLNNSGLSCHPK